MAKLQYRYQGSLSCPNIAVRMTQPDNCFDLQLLWAKLYIKDTNNKYPGSTWTVLLCIDGQWRYYSHHQWRYHSHHQWRYHSHHQWRYHITSGDITQGIRGVITHHQWRYHSVIKGVTTHHQWCYHTSSVALSLRVSEALWHIISGVITRIISGVIIHHQCRYSKPWPSPFCLNFHMNKRQF